MAVPYQVAATALKELIDEEFAAENIVAIHDKLHESLGDRSVCVGISPIRESPGSTNRVVNEMRIFVQFYHLWDKIIDPNQMVNPFLITGMADRFRRAVGGSQTAAGTSDVWFYTIEDISYPDDPTGNKTRFEATILARGNNYELLESIA